MSARRAPAAELVMIGTEMLALGMRDTNSEFLKRELAELGYEVRQVSVAADDEELLRDVLRAALRRADLTILGGGLGPTGDDRTRQALARALGVRLRAEARSWERIRAWYRARRRLPKHGARAQALLPSGALGIDNPLGSAPGIWWERRGKRAVALPGVPSELMAMWRQQVKPRLMQGGGARALASFSVGGLPEAEVDSRIARLYRRRNLDVTVLARTDHIEVHVRARRAGPEGQREVARAARQVRRLLGASVYAEGEVTLERAVGERLRRRGESLAVAESCTGGLLAARLTSVPGSSDYFLGGVTAYADAVKRRVLGVPASVLRRHGAVSAPCARALAEGARRRLGSHWALALTGIAGPGGGSTRKPVGTVFLGLARRGGAPRARRLHVRGDRAEIRQRAAAAALLWLDRRLRAGGRGGM
jgi:nicotinamide-nucleotide amidase